MFGQIVFLSLLLFSRLNFSLYLSEGLSTTSITKKESGERKRERRGAWGVLQPLTSPPRPQENALQSGARLPPTHSLNHDPSIFPTILPFSKENHLQSIKKEKKSAYLLIKTSPSIFLLSTLHPSPPTRPISSLMDTCVQTIIV